MITVMHLSGMRRNAGGGGGAAYGTPRRWNTDLVDIFFFLVVKNKKARENVGGGHLLF
jgi:hypothetical protein